MKNPLKKINFKSKKKELQQVAGLAGELVAEKTELVEKCKALDIRCQSLELTVREQHRKIKELENIAFQNKQAAVKFKQDLHEASFKVAMYSDLASKLSQENVKLKQRIPAVYETEGQIKEVKKICQDATA